MRRFILPVCMLLLLASCDSYLQEELGFLELPFEYEGRVDPDFFNPSWDLAWGVPDNGDDDGVYLGTDEGGFYDLYYFEEGSVSFLGSLAEPRRVGSSSLYEWFVSIDGNGGGELIRLYNPDLGVMFLPAESDTLTTPSTTANSRLLVYGLKSYTAVIENDLLLQEALLDIPSGAQFGASTDLLVVGNVTLNAILTQAFPEAIGSPWGTPTVDLHAFAPAEFASYNGEHKFIVSRTDGLTGQQKTVLLSVDKTSFELESVEIAAKRDFYFVSRDRFVGMDGSYLRIYDAEGRQLESHEMEGMRLLGYRSGVEEELVFLYSSDEDDGDRVYGIYSLPAKFVKEAK